MSNEHLINELVMELKSCRRCTLYKSATNLVIGNGCLDAKVMLIGEAPGYWEDMQGKPFVGSAGKILDELFHNIELKRDSVYISNIVKHRPPGNRDPKLCEIEACTPYLDKQIQIIKPKVIVTLGRHSTRYILSKIDINIEAITAVRGKIHDTSLFKLPIKIIPTFHPAAVLYNRKLKSVIAEDFQKMKQLIT